MKMKNFKSLKGLFTFLLCMCVFAASAQNLTIQGVVTDSYNEPVIGATIVVEGNTTQGTVTDIDGNFTLANVPANANLIFSYVGLQSQTVAVNGRTTINVTLSEDSELLDEVVVTALGMKRSAKALGYAMTELKGDDININAINPVNALQGKVAGVEIAQSDGGLFGSTKILIRGVSTLGANNQPIYVVDGVILDNATSNSGDADWSQSAGDWGNELKNLNPDDFETISVLKGAAATALYGSRGLNGAVVITTKSGRAQPGLGISFSQTFGVDQVFKQPDLQNIYGAGILSGYVSYGNTDAAGSYYRFQNQEQFLYNSEGDRRFNTTGYGFGPRFDGSSIYGYDNQLTTYRAYENNYKDMYNTGFNTNTNLTIQGGNEKTTYYSSLSYRYAEGTLPNNRFDRLSFLAKASHQITKNVNIEASMTFGNSNPRNPQPNIGELFTDGTFKREYDPSYYRHKYAGEHGGLAQSSYGDQYGTVPGRSLWWSLYQNSNNQQETSVRPYMALTVNLLDWLTLKAEANYNYYYTDQEIKNPNSGYARTYENGNGSYQLSKFTKKQQNANITALVDKQLNADWSLTGFLRGEYYDNRQNYSSTWTNGGLVVPDQFFITNSVNTVGYQSYVSGTKRMYSIAGQIGTSWRNQVYVDITGRNDWSSSLVYTNKTGHYSYFYPSVNGSVILSELLELPSWITFGKVRASWAQVGNDTEAYLINSAYSLNTISQDGSNVNSLVIPNTMYDTNLKPERKNAWEVGLDWRFFSNRIGIDATYYKENTKNQIMEISVPSVSGIDAQLINAGNIQNSGVELSLHTVPFVNKDWEVAVDFTYTKNRSKIISLHENVADYILLDGSTNYGNYRIGSVAKVGAEYGLLMTDSKPKVDESTGLEVLSWSNTNRFAYAQRSGQEEEIGSINPKFLGSITPSVRYKNFQLRAALDMRFGGYVASYNSRYGTAYGFTEASLKYSAPEYDGITWTSGFDGITYRDGYIPEGIFAAGTAINQADGTVYTVKDGGETYQSLYEDGRIEPTHASAWHYWRNSWGQGVVNDDWVKELNYIALREISLYYTCPTSFANKLGAGSLSLALTGRNLGYLLNTAPGGENPESIRGTTAYSFRMRSYSAYTANFMFTINATF